jgi:hypothetical protein
VKRRHRLSVVCRIGAAQELVQRLASDAEAEAVCNLLQRKALRPQAANLALVIPEKGPAMPRR